MRLQNERSIILLHMHNLWDIMGYRKDAVMKGYLAGVKDYEQDMRVVYEQNVFHGEFRKK